VNSPVGLVEMAKAIRSRGRDQGFGRELRGGKVEIGAHYLL